MRVFRKRSVIPSVIAIIGGLGVGLTAAAGVGLFGSTGTDDRALEPQSMSAQEIADVYHPGRPWDGRGRGNLDLDGVRDFPEFPVYWLGESFEGYNLQAITHVTQTAPAGRPARESFSMIRLTYGSCTPLGDSPDASCSVPLSLVVRDVCLVGPSDVSPTVRDSIGQARGNGEAVWFNDGHVMVWTGRSSIAIHAPGQPELTKKALAALAGAGKEPNQVVAGSELLPPDRVGCTK